MDVTLTISARTTKVRFSRSSQPTFIHLTHLEFEAFDEGLDRRIWSLSEQCLQWDVDIAKKRRERPQEVEKLLRDILQDNWEDSKFDSAALEKDLVYGGESTPLNSVTRFTSFHQTLYHHMWIT